MRLALGKVLPLVKVESLKRAVRSIHHHLGAPLKQQGERPLSGANIYCLPQPIENKHMLIQMTHLWSICRESSINPAEVSNSGKAVFVGFWHLAALYS